MDESIASWYIPAVVVVIIVVGDEDVDDNDSVDMMSAARTNATLLVLVVYRFTYTIYNIKQVNRHVPLDRRVYLHDPPCIRIPLNQ